MQELLKRLQDRHVECAQAVAKKAAADGQAVAAVSKDTPSVIQVMMLFQKAKRLAKHRAKAAEDRAKDSQEQAKSSNNHTLQSEKDNDVDQKEVQELQRVMEPKRVRTQSATTDDDECENSHGRTGTSLIIVVRLHSFETDSRFLSVLAEKFRLHRKTRRVL